MPVRRRPREDGSDGSGPALLHAAGRARAARGRRGRHVLCALAALSAFAAGEERLCSGRGVQLPAPFPRRLADRWPGLDPRCESRGDRLRHPSEGSLKAPAAVGGGQPRVRGQLPALSPTHSATRRHLFEGSFPRGDSRPSRSTLRPATGRPPTRRGTAAAGSGLRAVGCGRPRPPPVAGRRA